MNNNQKTAADPEIPDGIKSRRPVALTHIAAETGAEEREGTTELGHSGIKHIDEPTPQQQAQAAKMRAAKARKARERAEKSIPAEPLKGLTREQIEEVRARSYPGAPKMDPNLGDKTPAFVNWIYKNQPADAAIRYYARDVWPTE